MASTIPDRCRPSLQNTRIGRFIPGIASLHSAASRRAHSLSTDGGMGTCSSDSWGNDERTSDHQPGGLRRRHRRVPSAGGSPARSKASTSSSDAFVVELTESKLIAEIKAENEMADPIVREKARAAAEWIKHANEFADEGDGKHWRYALIPDRALTENATLAGLTGRFVSD